jgi:hypothetical protein
VLSASDDVAHQDLADGFTQVVPRVRAGPGPAVGSSRSGHDRPDREEPRRNGNVRTVTTTRAGNSPVIHDHEMIMKMIMTKRY